MMVIRWLLIVFVCVFGALLLCVSTSTAMARGCSSIEEKPVKVEAWLSKQYEKNLRQIRNEFSAMGNTRVTLWVYSAENPSKIVAIVVVFLLTLAAICFDRLWNIRAG